MDYKVLRTRNQTSVIKIAEPPPLPPAEKMNFLQIDELRIITQWLLRRQQLPNLLSRETRETSSQQESSAAGNIANQSCGYPGNPIRP